jgi:hypothetical protein
MEIIEISTILRVIDRDHSSIRPIRAILYQWEILFPFEKDALLGSQCVSTIKGPESD